MLGARCPPGASACTLRRWVPGSCSGRRVEMMPRPCSVRRTKGLPGSRSSSVKMGRWRRAAPGARCTTSRPAAMPRGRVSSWYCSVGGPAEPQSGVQRPTHTLHESRGGGRGTRDAAVCQEQPGHPGPRCHEECGTGTPSPAAQLTQGWSLSGTRPGMAHPRTGHLHGC